MRPAPRTLLMRAVSAVWGFAALVALTTGDIGWPAPAV
jgi:hypothetical protein